MNTQHSRQRHPGQGDLQGHDARDRGDERQGQMQRSHRDLETGSGRWDENVEGARGRDRGDSGDRDSQRGAPDRRALGTQGAQEEGRFMPGGGDFGSAMYGESRGTRDESEQARSYNRSHDVGYRGYAEDTPGSGRRNNLSTGYGERGEGFRGDYDREYTRNQGHDPGHGPNDRAYGQSSFGGSDGNQRGMQPRSEWIGKGPKGYTRSSERIREQVSELLSQGYLDASDIEVTVSGDTVTLSGTVADRQTKRLAEQIVGSCSWVGDVENKLRIGARDTLSSRDQSETGSSAASSKRPSN